MKAQSEVHVKFRLYSNQVLGGDGLSALGSGDIISGEAPIFTK